MTLEEVQSLGAIPAVVLVTIFLIAFFYAMRYDRRRVAKLRADWMQQQRELAALRAGTPVVVPAFVPTGAEFDAGGLGQQGAMRFDDGASDRAFMDDSRWIGAYEWTSMNPCAVGGPGPDNNFGHSAGLAHNSWDDH